MATIHHTTRGRRKRGAVGGGLRTSLVACLLVLCLLIPVFSGIREDAYAASIPTTSDRVATGLTTIWYRPDPPIGNDPQLLLAIDLASGETKNTYTVAAGDVIAGVTGDTCLLKGVNGALRAYTPETTSPLWSYDELSDAVVLGGDETVAYLAGTFRVEGVTHPTIVSIDPATGIERWRIALGPLPTGESVSSLRGVVTQGIVLLWIGQTGTLYGADTETGSLAWSIRAKSLVKGPFVTSTGLLYLMVKPGSSENIVRAYDLHSGAPRWTVDLSDIDGASGIQQVANAGDVVLLSYITPTSIFQLFDGGPSGGVVAVDQATGKIRWRYPTKGEWLQGDIAFAKDERGLSIMVEEGIIALDPATGKVRWRTTLDQPASMIGTTGGMLLLSPETGRPRLLAVDSESGKRGWESIPSGNVTAPFAAVLMRNETVIVLGDSLTALNVTTGESTWSVGPPVSFTPTPLLNEGKIERLIVFAIVGTILLGLFLLMLKERFHHATPTLPGPTPS